MGEAERRELILEFRELRRQAKRCLDAEGSDAKMPSEIIQHIEKPMERFRAGLITEQELEREADQVTEEIRRLERQTGDPAMVMGLDAKNEVAARGLGATAELLSADSHQAAQQGISKEKWIADVIAGHAGDDTAQICCLVYIIELWRNGPWPWPREDAD
jgi:hypothetical protein